MRPLKGWLGEKRAAFKLWLTLDERVYKRFHGPILPSSNGTTQIDHLLVSKYGIFIIETKNKGGWIFGSENSAKWTQTFYQKKYSFQNPLRQTFRQKKVLSEFLAIDESYIRTVVYFVGNCKFKTPLPSNVMRSGIGRYIKSFDYEVLTQNEIDRIINKLEKHFNESTISIKDHVRSLSERHNSRTVCPNCGASLKMKASKRGTSAGTKFIGCENYPKCRFTKSA